MNKQEKTTSILLFLLILSGVCIAVIIHVNVEVDSINNKLLIIQNQTNKTLAYNYGFNEGYNYCINKIKNLQLKKWDFHAMN